MPWRQRGRVKILEKAKGKLVGRPQTQKCRVRQERAWTDLGDRVGECNHNQHQESSSWSHNHFRGMLTRRGAASDASHQYFNQKRKDREKKKRKNKIRHQSLAATSRV
jgi:hypothetical protein